jgi:hypothetical protein
MDANLCKLSLARESIVRQRSQSCGRAGHLTFTGLPVANQTVTVGAKVYTFRPNVPQLLFANDVLIGATAAATATNLINAINAHPDFAGVTFAAATVAHTRAYAKTGGSGIVTVEAIFPGIAPGLVAATGTLTSDTVIPTANDTVTIDGKVYTFKGVPAVEGDVLVSISAAATLTNLFHAINKSGGVDGEDYVVAAAHPTVSATNPTATTVVLTARAAGTGGNAITTTEASTHLSFGGAVLSGGTDDTIATTETCTNAAFGAATLTGGVGTAPLFQELRFTGESIVPGKQTVISGEIRSDRSIADVILVGLDAKGSTNHEVHTVGLDEMLLAALLASDWVTDAAVDATLTVTGQTIECAAGWGLASGARYIKLANFADAGNNGVKKIVSVSGTTLTLAAGSMVANAEEAADWSIRYARPGVTLYSYALMKEFRSLVPAQAALALGMVLNQFDLSLDSKSIAKCVATWMGAKQVTNPGSYARQTPTAPTTKPIMNTTSNVGSLLYDAVAVDNPIMKMNLSINNNLGERPQIGSLITAKPRTGSAEIKGQITTYFKSRDLFVDFLAHAMRSLEFPLRDSLGGVINFYMPQVRFPNASNLIGSINSDVSLPLDFHAVLGSASYMLQVDNLSL